MFSVLKVRRDLPKGRYVNPDWFAQGPRAREVDQSNGEKIRLSQSESIDDYEIRVIKPSKKGKS